MFMKEKLNKSLKFLLHPSYKHNSPRK